MKNDSGQIRSRFSRLRQRGGLKLLGSSLAALLVLCSGIAIAAPGDPSKSSSDELSGPAPAPRGREIPEERTAISATFQLPDGRREARIYAAPVNYLDSEGGWKPIEEGLESRADGGFANGANSFDLRLPERLGSASVRLSVDGNWVSDRLLGGRSEPAEVNGNTATYEGASSGTAFELSSVPTGVKETIELEDPSQPSTFRYELAASQGLTPSLEDDGSVAFRKGDGSEVVRMPAPTIIDSAEGAEPAPRAINYDLASRRDGSWVLTVEVDKAWLEAPDRVWPVKVDPTMEAKSRAVQICEYSLSEPSGATNKYGACNNYFSWAMYKRSGGVATRIRSALWFPMTTGYGPIIPLDSSIASASANLYNYEPANGITAMQLRRATKKWNSTVNWFRYENGPTNSGPEAFWTTPGGDFTSEGSEAKTSERGTAPGWWVFNGLGQIASEWLHQPAQNNGLILKVADETPCESCTRGPFMLGSTLYFEEFQPYLSIKYYPPAPETSKLTSPTEGRVTGRRLKLQAAWQVAGVTGIRYQFREGKSGYFQDIPANLIRNASGKTVSWPQPLSNVKQSPPFYFDAAHATAALRKKGGTVQVRALFEGLGSAPGFSQPVEAKVNRLVGGPNDAAVDIGPGSLDLLTGNFTVTETDVSIPGFGASLEFARTHSTRDLSTEAGSDGVAVESKSVLGPGWKPGVPVEEAGGANWRSVRRTTVSEVYEGQTYSYDYAVVTALDGAEFAFELLPDGSYATPPESPGWALSASGNTFILSDPSGDRTTFNNFGGGTEYLPTEVSQVGGPNNRSRMVWELVGKRRLKEIVAPNASGINCDASPRVTPGCRVLAFSYLPATTWGAPSSYGDRLSGITYFAQGSGAPAQVAAYEYDSSGRLAKVWDPRTSPALTVQYAYEPGGQLRTITPAGEEPWTLSYGSVDEEEGIGRLMSVKRASLVASPSVATTSIVYDVPLSAPYSMGGATIAQWGQQDVPVDATAVFPPDQVPPVQNQAESFARATVYYMDSDGFLVNTATPSGGGTTAPSITTAETDEFGNVVRELSAQNRLRALAAGENSVARSKELETKRNFSADGTEMEEEWGPLHTVKLESGETTAARLHKVVVYDQNWSGPGVRPHLPTEEATGASIPAQAIDADQRLTRTVYDQALRKPTLTIADPGGANIRTVIDYDDSSGQQTEIRQPSDANQAGAGTTKTVYYSAGGGGPCGGKAEWAGLPCEVAPAVQPSTPGLPQVPIRRVAGYNSLSQPTEVIEEQPGSPGVVRRTTRTTYDPAGRLRTIQQLGDGVPVPKIEILYSPTNGKATAQRFVCESQSCEGFNDRAITAAYDTLGRLTEFRDADGGLATSTYDLLGRPVTTTDGKGSQTRIYDPISGLMTELQDSAAGTFTAAYDANGSLTRETLPNGLTAEVSYNEVGEAEHLAWVKETSCGVSCTWYAEDIETSVYGQDMAQQSTSASRLYSYDTVGRLKQVQETPSGGNCMSRSYGYDANSNRTTLTTRTASIGAACPEAGGTTKTYGYDGADRLVDSGIAYDGLGRTTSLAGGYAGGQALTTTYFVNDMVASQSQGGVTNTFEVDPSLRQRRRVQTGSLEGAELFHYAGPGDAVAWTESGPEWTRNISGIGGSLVAVQSSQSGVAFQLTDLHGDVCAAASASPTATSLLATYRYDEFGIPLGSAAAPYGWLGGKQRRTEFDSGVIQMGERSYVPQIGRFLSKDPVYGGSANAYEYAGADPVNSFDLLGTKRHGKARGRGAQPAVATARVARPATGSRPRQWQRPPPPLPPPPLLAGVCAFATIMTDVIPGSYPYAHGVSAETEMHCSHRATVVVQIRIGGRPQWISPPSINRGVKEQTFSLVSTNYLSTRPGPVGNLPLSICFHVYWQEEGATQDGKECSPWAKAIPK